VSDIEAATEARFPNLCKYANHGRISLWWETWDPVMGVTWWETVNALGL